VPCRGALIWIQNGVEPARVVQARLDGILRP
jgi:hypothetical protein